MFADPPGAYGFSSHSLGHCPFASRPRRARLARGHNHSTTCLLGFMGRHTPSPAPATAKLHRQHPPLVSAPAPCLANTPGRLPGSSNLVQCRLAATSLERPHASHPAPTTRPVGRTNGEPWVATPSIGTHPHQLPHRTPGIIHSGRPSNAPLPGWSFRQPGIHNHPFQPRLHIPVRFVPGPAVEAPPPPPSLDSSSLPVPSPS